MNPKLYCAEHEIPTAEFVATAKSCGAPKYCKAAHSMASNPAYGVQLRPSLIKRMGIKVKRANRQKPCRVTFRLRPEDYRSFRAACTANGHTMQEAGEYAATLYMTRS